MDEKSMIQSKANIKGKTGEESRIERDEAGQLGAWWGQKPGRSSRDAESSQCAVSKIKKPPAILKFYASLGPSQPHLLTIRWAQGLLGMVPRTLRPLPVSSLAASLIPN